MNALHLILKSRKLAGQFGNKLQEFALIYNRMATTSTRSEQLSYLVLEN